MKPSLIITYSLVCLLAFCGGIFAGLFYTDRQNDAVISAEADNQSDSLLVSSVPASPSPTPMPSATPHTEKEQYMLTASDNGISVYKIMDDGTTSFIMSREVDTSHLRQEDFSELCRGMVVNNYEQAIKLLEDFSG